MSENAIITYQGGAILPVVDVQTALKRYQDMKDFIKGVLHEGIDYGKIPGTDKDTLLKPGAEKLDWFFGLRPIFKDIEHIEDWTGINHGEPFFYYRVQCELVCRGEIVAAADGSANSWEKKHRYRWVNETDIPNHLDKSKLKTRGGRTSEFTFAVEKAETSGQYGKPAEYWKRFNDAIANGTATPIKRKAKSGREMDAWEIDTTLYCIPNDDVADLVNTILKMAQKRALVAATLIGANASEWFTQDMEDFIDGVVTEVTTTPTPPPAPGNGKAATAEKPWTSTVISLATAQTETASDGETLYWTMPTQDLSTRVNSLNATLKKGTIKVNGQDHELTAEERTARELKRDIIQSILDYRQ